MSENYEIEITQTMKLRSWADQGYSVFNRKKKSFGTLEETKQYLTDMYKECKRVKMFRDVPGAEAVHVGRVYCWGGYDEYGNWQQDRVEVIHVQTTTITKGLG